MLKKTITYSDLDGNDVTEDFYFNLSKAEIAETELSYDGGLTAHLKRIVEAKNGEQIIGTFKNIIMMSVGRRSEDGKRFIKSDEITQEFMQTNAYSELFMELVTNADASAGFIRAIVPSSLSEKMDEQLSAIQQKGQDVRGETLKSSVIDETDDRPAWIKENREPTKHEVAGMSREQLMEAMYKKNQQLLGG